MIENETDEKHNHDNHVECKRYCLKGSRTGNSTNRMDRTKANVHLAFLIKKKLTLIIKNLHYAKLDNSNLENKKKAWVANNFGIYNAEEDHTIEGLTHFDHQIRF